MACRLIVLILLTAPVIYCHKVITILSDFNNDKDVEFFKTTLPWIVDNIGSDIDLKFHFNDSGVKSGPRQCVLFQLSRNSYLQVDYLSCEANGSAYTECIKHLPIDILRLHRCLRSNVKRIVKNAEREFQRFKASVTPVVILPRRRIINDNSPQNILKSICDLYPRQYPMRPIGCIKTSPLPGKNQENEKTNETSTPQTETTPNEKNQEEKPTPESEAELKEENSRPESEIKPKEEKSEPESKEKQNDDNSKPESETKPKEEKSELESKEKQNNDNNKQESEAKPKEEKSDPKSEEKENKEQSQPESEAKL
ncbi:serine/threonine-protein phosphatase 4 regulatory subunit 2-like [Vanessa atalanta]|uniref:serine/threonine-protein phosphatase 4 regulatory subunit 2-like n=1 Tax=Vanessa atalanta TaxID=42275 RepID=UPI001FCDFC85|nr:serine/threonine-protein phosphatase 4 regulatory subunit 2-like [Vanessa atalanta]